MFDNPTTPRDNLTFHRFIADVGKCYGPNCFIFAWITADGKCPVSITDIAGDG
jgi:hypothetical protein